MRRELLGVDSDGGSAGWVELVNGVGTYAGAAATVFATLRGIVGDDTLAAGLIRDGWSNGYLYLGPPEPVSEMMRSGGTSFTRARTKEEFAELVAAKKVVRGEGGKFARISAVAKALLSGDPNALSGIDREPLRREAMKRGIATKGLSTDALRDALWDHELDGVDTEADLPAAQKAELDLTRLTVPQLKERAKVAKVPGYSKMRKPELLAALGPKPDAADPRARQMREDHDAIMSWRAEDRARAEVVSPSVQPASGLKDAARQRQARIDTAKARADVLAELREVTLNESDPDTMHRQLSQAARRNGVDGDPDIQALLDAVRDYDDDSISDARAAIEDKYGLNSVGYTQVQAFDPAIHEPVGDRPRPGQAVELIRPGYTADVDGERVQLSKAVVQVADAKPAAPKPRAPRAPKPSAVNMADVTSPANDMPDASDIQTVSNRKELTSTQLAQGEHLTPAGRRALDALGPAGHPRLAAIPDTEGKVREAFRMLAVPGMGNDHWVALADMRKLFGDQVTREEFDDTVKRMRRTNDDVRTSPQHYARGNAATRRPAAIMIGGGEHDQIHIDDPTLSRPGQFGAVAMAEELQNRRAGRPGDPMMALLPDADLQAEIDRRAASDPIVARDLARMGAPAGASAKPGKSRAPLSGKQPVDMATVTSQLEALRRNPQQGDREKVAAVLAPLTGKQLDQIILDNGWQTSIRGNLAQKREQIAQNMVGRKLTSDAIFATKNMGPTPEQLAAEIETGKNRILQAFQRLLRPDQLGEDQPWISIADLRDELSDLPRGQVDAALQQLVRDGKAVAVPASNQKVLTDRDRHAMIRIGNENKLHLTIGKDARENLLGRSRGDEPEQRRAAGWASGNEREAIGLLLSAFDRAGDPSEADITRWARAAGADTHPGGEELKHYWTQDPEGLAIWADSPDPWTVLYDHLITKIKNPEKTKRIVSAWYQIVFGGPVGWKKGRNPNGPG
jgi:hypothetical protein